MIDRDGREAPILRVVHVPRAEDLAEGVQRELQRGRAGLPRGCGAAPATRPGSDGSQSLDNWKKQTRNIVILETG